MRSGKLRDIVQEKPPRIPVVSMCFLIPPHLQRSHRHLKYTQNLLQYLQVMK